MPGDCFASATHKQFAHRFGISVGALRHWERGERTPRRPSLALLNAIERNPRAVLVGLRHRVKIPCAACGEGGELW